MNLTIDQLPEHGYSTIGCRFSGNNRIYTYLCHCEAKVGDIAVVKARDELKLVTVVSINPPAPNPDKIEYKWIIGLVDISNYNNVKHIKLIA